MSLKLFHIIFVAAATVLTVAFGGWALSQFVQGGAATYVVAAAAAGLFALLLVIYAIWVIHKFSGASFR